MHEGFSPRGLLEGFVSGNIDLLPTTGRTPDERFLESVAETFACGPRDASADVHSDSFESPPDAPCLHSSFSSDNWAESPLLTIWEFDLEDFEGTAAVANTEFSGSDPAVSAWYMRVLPDAELDDMVARLESDAAFVATLLEGLDPTGALIVPPDLLLAPPEAC